MDSCLSSSDSQTSPSCTETGLGKPPDSPTLLTALETCPRKAFLSHLWRRNKLKPVETLRESLHACLTAPNHPDDATWGDAAGSKVLDLAASPGLDAASETLYSCAMNIACLSDLIVSVLRKEPDKAWLIPEPVQHWTSACLMAPEGNVLRRLAIVSHWTDDRHYNECRSWYTVGELAAYGLPMQLVVLVIGHERNGRRHSHWTKALRHTIGKDNIRFRRRVGNTSGGFKDSWTEIFREDHDEISRETWLTAMLKDDVLKDLCFRVDMPALTKEQRKLYGDLAKRKLDSIEKMKAKPPLQLSGCDYPVKCQFLQCCHGGTERDPSEKLGFVRISPRTPQSQGGIRRATETQLDPCSPVQ